MLKHIKQTYLSGLPTDSKAHFLIPILIALPFAVAAFFVDGTFVEYAAKLRPHIQGDLKRVLETLQQYGDASYVLIAGLFILTLDPARRRYLLDLIAGLKTTSGRQNSTATPF